MERGCGVMEKSEGREDCAATDTEAAVKYFLSNVSRVLLIMQESHFRCRRLSEHELRVSKPVCCDWKLLFTHMFVTFLSCAVAG